MSCDVNADEQVEQMEEDWVDNYNWDEHFENLQGGSVVVHKNAVHQQLHNFNFDRQV